MCYTHFISIHNKKIFVTGAGGFIGSHLTETLVKSGCQVKAFVHYNSFNSHGWLDHLTSSIRNSLEIISGDITDPHGIKTAMQNSQIVFHLAALIGIPYSYYSPNSYVETNIKGTLNILQAARELEVEKVIHTSTSEVYGTAQSIPIAEQHPINPQSPYAATKASADFLALSFHRSFDLPVTLVRPFNTYGPRQSARAIVPTIITQLLAHSKSVKLGSLTPTRDLTYMQDTVNGFIAAAESKQALGQIFNLGSNYEISVNDLAHLIAKILKLPLRLQTEKLRQRPIKSEVNRLCADNTKARKELNWRPHYSLTQGLKKTIDWFTDPTNIKHYKATVYTL